MAESAKKISGGGLHIDQRLYALVAEQIAPGTGVDVDHFWAALEKIVQDLEPKNQQLLQRRAALQAQIDAYHQERRGEPLDPTGYRTFLEEIGYLLPTGDAHQIRTENTDPETASLAGPQLVVPVDNARYALNAANARWGSLYDALYGTDVIPGAASAEYDAANAAPKSSRAARRCSTRPRASNRVRTGRWWNFPCARMPAGQPCAPISQAATRLASKTPDSSSAIDAKASG